MTSPNQPTTSSSTLDRVVVFADILGFASLTEANPIDVRTLRLYERPLSLTIDDLAEILSGTGNPLTEAFSRFHRFLKGAIMTAEMRHSLTAITFSDSVFIATNYLHEAASFA